MQQLFGLDTRGNYRDGCMQDAHWAEGLFGHFPTYTLGAFYAAQWSASMRRDLQGFDQLIARGELDGLFDWLRDRIWSQASHWETSELVRRASGESLNPVHFRRHLESRYLCWRIRQTQSSASAPGRDSLPGIHRLRRHEDFPGCLAADPGAKRASCRPGRCPATPGTGQLQQRTASSGRLIVGGPITI
jgi:Carboxypeptidase Taq (M32) metallopeptidase